MFAARSSGAVYSALILVLVLLATGCSTNKKPAKTPPPPDTKGLSERQMRREVVNYALQYLGAAYKYAGTNPKTGFDCSGYTSFIMRQFNIVLSPASTAQSKEGKAIPLTAVQPGDLIIFGKNKNNIQHVALVVERSSAGIIVVHSTTSRGVIKENVSTSPYWKPLILSARDVISK